MSTLPPSADVRQIVDQAMQAAHLETEAGNSDQALALYGAVLDLQPGHAGAHHAVAVLAISVLLTLVLGAKLFGLY